MHPGLVGGIIGGVVGLLGGVIGTWASIRNTRSQRERRFVAVACVITWAGFLAFAAAFLLLPVALRYFLWIPYSILLPVGIFFWNKKQASIRREDQGESEQPPA